MTTERFNKVEVYISYEIYDNKTNEQLDVNKTVDLMNQLNDENEQLKEEIKQYRAVVDNHNRWKQCLGRMELEE